MEEIKITPEMAEMIDEYQELDERWFLIENEMDELRLKFFQKFWVDFDEVYM